MTYYDNDEARLRFRVKVGVGKSNVQLPNGFFYAAGDEVDLTPYQYESITQTAFDDGVLTDLGPVTPVEVRSTDYDVTAATS